jgi:endonuclease/exonuclease/phosphatase family metal-dependent hydrolase
VSYNIHGCIGRDGAFRPDRIVDVLESLRADFIGLQEVEDRLFSKVRVSDYIAGRLGMNVYRGPAMSRDAVDYGNLLLTRLPAKQVIAHDLSVPGREPRSAIEAVFQPGEAALRLVVTHFGLAARERNQQLNQLADLLEQDKLETRLLIGDLNEWRPSSGFERRLRRMFGTTSKRRTFPSHRPALALDRILANPPAALSEPRAVRNPMTASASDHLPLVADLTMG